MFSFFKYVNVGRTTLAYNILCYHGGILHHYGYAAHCDVVGFTLQRGDTLVSLWYFKKSRLSLWQQGSCSQTGKTHTHKNNQHQETDPVWDVIFSVHTHTHTHNDESESLHVMMSSPVLSYCDVTEIFYKLFYWSRCTMLSLMGSTTELWEILSDPHHVTIEGKQKRWKYHLNCTLFQL